MLFKTVIRKFCLVLPAWWGILHIDNKGRLQKFAVLFWIMEGREREILLFDVKFMVPWIHNWGGLTVGGVMCSDWKSMIKLV